MTHQEVGRIGEYTGFEIRTRLTTEQMWPAASSNGNVLLRSSIFDHSRAYLLIMRIESKEAIT